MLVWPNAGEGLGTSTLAGAVVSYASFEANFASPTPGESANELPLIVEVATGAAAESSPVCAGWPQFTDAGAKTAKAPPEGACPGGEVNVDDAAPNAGFPKVG